MRKFIAVAGLLVVSAAPAWAGAISYDCREYDDCPPVAVPEPASLTLIASGVAALGAVAVRRRRDKK